MEMELDACPGVGGGSPSAIAPASSRFHCSAMPVSSGSSGFGALINAYASTTAYKHEIARQGAVKLPHLNAQENSANLKRRAPLVLQNV
jgi:hypothetical protein